MGYHVKYKQLQSIQQSILTQIDNWYNQLEEVAKKLIDVAEMDHIKGATGESIKNYIYEIHIPIIQTLTQLLAEYETKLLIYANEYYEIDSNTSAEIAQDELEDQMEKLNEKKETFNESDESLRKTLNSISNIISLKAPSAYGVRSNYTGLYNKAENLRDKIGEHEESHFNSDFYIMDEMLSKLSGLINNQIGKADFSITNYEVGAITKLSNYETLSKLYAKQQDYLNNNIEERAKAMEGYNIRQQIIAEETYAKERIAEGGLQTVGGVISVVAGVGLIIATAGMATPIIAGAFVVGSCSTFYGLSNTTEGTQSLYYGFSGDGTSVAVNPIRDTYFASNPELYYKIGNASTIISTMGTPVAKGIPIEKVMATQTKRLASGAVGSVASNALMDRYDLNPYIAMGIGMGISGITYMGIEAVGNMEYVNRLGAKPVEATGDVKVVNKVLVDEKDSFSSYGDLMSPEEEARYSKYWTIKSSKCSTEDLYKYLSNIEPDITETYLKTGQWPNEIQVPKSSNVLNADGSIKWSDVPGGGYTLDSNEKPIKDSYIPNIGETLDRYGTPDGRYTSPIINKMPYSYEQRSLPYVEEVAQYHRYEVIGNFEKLKSYIDKCSDTKLKMQIDAYVDKYYGGDYSRLTIYKGEIAAGFSETGGGIQYELPMKIEWLEKLELIKEIK